MDEADELWAAHRPEVVDKFFRFHSHGVSFSIEALS